MPKAVQGHEGQSQWPEGTSLGGRSIQAEDKH